MLTIMTNRKIVLFLVLLSLGLLWGGKKSNAYSDSTINILDFEKSVFEDKKFNNPSHAYGNIGNISNSLSNMIMGCASQSCQEKLGVDAGGAVGNINNLIASLYATPPASSAYYLADLGQRLNIAQPVYAQGVGFSGLQPLLPLWRAARNIAYTFFVLIFIITGFAIIFRAKISPQAVVTIQSAIPKAIMALILVTFSYAIAGLMIDLMYLLIGIIFSIIPAEFIASLPHDNVSYYYTGGFGEIIHNVWNAGWGAFKGILNLGGGAIILGGAMGIGAIVGAIIAGPVGLFGSIAVGGIFLLIVALILLFITVKIFFALLTAYLGIVVSILIAPIQLMLSAIPGQNTFGSWISNLLKNILVFPATVGMFLLAFIMSDLSSTSGGQGLWAPPLLGFWGEKAGQAIGALLGFGIILMIPKVTDIIKGMFEKKPFEYGGALGQALGPAKGIGKTAYMAGGSFLVTRAQRRGQDLKAGLLSTLTGARGEGRPLDPEKNKEQKSAV
jgi:hypothetical protein